MTVTIAIDAMGGDDGVRLTLSAAAQALRAREAMRLLLVGRLDDMQPLLRQHGLEQHPRVALHQADEVVTMDDPLEVALRKKRGSSMRVACELVRDGKASAMVSAGNTGALMAISRYVLKTLPGIDRPAIATFLPNRSGRATLVLDLGANVDCLPEHLLQFALMGSAYFSAVTDEPSPRVGLLNVGQETIKGSQLVKTAGELLQAHADVINFVGNVEGNDVFSGAADVIVCDGFVGNAVLKAVEGVSRMLAGFIREEFQRGLYSRLAALVGWPVLSRFKQRADPRLYNGAALLGLRGLVVKSHGGTDDFGYRHAVVRAYDAASHNLIDGIARRVQAIALEAQETQEAQVTQVATALEPALSPSA